MDTKAIGLRIKQAREAMRPKVTQTALGQQIGFSQAQVNRLERGERKVSIPVLKKIARVLNVTEAYLMGHDTYDHSIKTDPRTAILSDYETAAGLKELAVSQELLTVLKITSEEWSVLAALANSWSIADLIHRDGWVQILLTLRAVSPKS